MNGFVEVGICRNDACGQYGGREEDGYCSESCREEATGCGVPGCTCGGADQGGAP
jgi:hypothetical protein